MNSNAHSPMIAVADVETIRQKRTAVPMCQRFRPSPKSENMPKKYTDIMLGSKNVEDIRLVIPSA